METREEYIKNALNKDVELSESEYREKCEQADKSTMVHCVPGRAPISEGKRHKRIQMNFYGTCLNVMLSVLAELNQVSTMLVELVGMQYASMPPAAKKQYEQLVKSREVNGDARK